jgi:hypothetical protein
LSLNAVKRGICVLTATTIFGVSVAAGSDSYVWTSAGAEADPGYRASYGSTRPLDEELLVPVSIWGEVRNPGYYSIPDGSDVTRLISYAGGPTEFANLGTVRLTRPGAGGDEAVDVDAYLDTGDVARLPVLQPGDTIYVRRNKKYAWREFVKIMSELAVIAGTVILYVEVAGGE